MEIVIDATNIKAGGGITHLKRIVEAYGSSTDTIVLIGGSWLNTIEAQKNVQKVILENEFQSIIKQELFKAFKLKKYLKGADIAFIPGGTFSNRKVRYVSMSQNMLVFENKERNRFPKSFTWLRYLLLEKLQVRSFKNAEGIIYISEYAKNYIENKYPELKNKKSTVIYHGISDDFRQVPKEQKSIETYTRNAPFKLVYVSIVNYYKHQWNVIDAVKKLRSKGYNITLELIGPLYEPLRSKFETALIGTEDYVFYKGRVAYDEISASYKNADMFIFASTCENMPNILVEAMSAGLPILSSNYGPMPEILKDGGGYMDPTETDDILKNLEYLLLHHEIRQELADKSYHYSHEFSWDKTAKQTFDFIKQVGLEHK